MQLSEKRLVGLKQSRRAVADGTAARAVIAGDSEEKIRRSFEELCQKHGVPYEYIPTMSELGKLCGIEVGAAVAVELR